MSLEGDDENSNIMFKSVIHQRFFNIILVDFLSVTDAKGPVDEKPYLRALRDIVADPKFDIDDSSALLKNSVNEFKEWLDQVVEIEISFPSINIETTIKLPRSDFIKMTGNISKHNYLRAVGVATKLKQALEDSGVDVKSNKLLLALAEFYERFHEDILNYHSSTIAEFLNNIRWGIYEYLQPEFHRSIVLDKGSHSYTYPEDINSELSKVFYRGLMNEVRRKPYMPKFKVTRWLKLRY